jgi:peptidoglycan/xylan/chitin deacetylase (PgdA/CDA1 family)
MNSVSIIAPKSNRLIYVCEYIFKEHWGIDFEIVAHENEIELENSSIIYYQNTSLGEGFRIRSSETLLDSNSIAIPQYSQIEEMQVLFPQSNCHLGFDIFAAIFYLISRYEEYNPNPGVTDEHGRFMYNKSILYRMRCLKVPIVQHWIAFFLEKLKVYYSKFEIKQREYSFESTLDIDNAYAYKHKGFVRSVFASAKDLANFNISGIADRIKVLSALKTDPYDTFDYILDIEKKYNVTSLFFWLLGNYSQYDRGLNYKSKALSDIITRIKLNHPIGIHPSYKSNTGMEVLKKEISRLSNISGEIIRNSRQHYLKLSIPKTYQNLVNFNIENDYSLGYANTTGFRAGSCVPFYFYDLNREERTPLKLIPFQVMDVTLNNFMGLDPDNALHEIKQVVDEVRKYNGTFVSLWHNETLTNQGKWKGWRRVFEEMMAYASA